MNMDVINSAVEEIRASYRAQKMGVRIGFGKKPVILVIDFQKCLNDPGRDAGGDMSKEINATKVLLDRAREKGIRIIYTVTAFDEESFDGGMFTKKIPALKSWIVGTEAAEVVDELERRPNEKVIVKKYTSAFLATGLASFLVADGYDTVIITGCSTSGCIRATTTDSACSGFRTILPRECINDRNPLTHEVNLMDMDTRYCDVMALEDVLKYIDTL